MSSDSETDFEDQKLATDSCLEQNEDKLDEKNLNSTDLNRAIFFENLSTSTCNTIVVKNDDIDIFYEDIKRETGEEKSRGFCEVCYQNFGVETDIFIYTSYRYECSCRKRNESIYNLRGQDMTRDAKTSFLDFIKESELNPLEVQDEIISVDEVTKERDSAGVPRRLSVAPMKNYYNMELKICLERLDTSLSPAESSKFISQYNILKVDGDHTCEKPFCCKICAKSFKKSHHLRFHERIHTSEKQFHCKICSKIFRHMPSLKIHERLHTGDKPFHCQICSKDFTGSSGLRAHKRIHTGEKPFHCEICSKSFRQRAHLKVHLRRHTGEKTFHCKICSKFFSDKGTLKRHETIHTGEKTFHCKICSKSFREMPNLKIHERIHTGEKPFHCKICSKSFRQIPHLKRHERTHTGEKPFYCKICSLSFSERVTLKRHETIHTGEKNI